MAQARVATVPLARKSACVTKQYFTRVCPVKDEAAFGAYCERYDNDTPHPAFCRRGWSDVPARSLYRLDQACIQNARCPFGCALECSISILGAADS